MSDSTPIFHAATLIADHDMTNIFLAPIKNGEALGEILRQGRTGLTQSYDDETRKAWYIASDGDVAHCCIVTDITLDEAATIAAECEIIRSCWSYGAFQSVVEGVLQAPFGRVN
jgi:hypothetical protein